MKQILQQFISRGETKKAIQYLQNHATDDSIKAEAIQLSARYETHARNKRLGISTTEEQNLTINQINHSLLELANQISDESSSQDVDNQPINKKKNWWQYITGAAVIIGILAGIAEFTGCNLQSLFGTSVADSTKDLVIYVHGSDGKQDYVLENEGELLVDLGGDRRYPKIGEKGRTVLSEIPAKFIGQQLSISVKAAGWLNKNPQATYLWQGEPIYFPIQRDSALLTIQGRVIDSESKEGLAEVAIMIDNQWNITTDSLGRFYYELTEKEYQNKYSLSFQKTGYQEATEFYYPTSSKEFRLTKKQ